LVVACWKREEKNVRFSIPKIFKISKISKIPELPELPALYRLRGRSCEKKKVFSA
jgi:hypothetical protein